MQIGNYSPLLRQAAHQRVNHNLFEGSNTIGRSLLVWEHSSSLSLFSPVSACDVGRRLAGHFGGERRVINRCTIPPPLVCSPSATMVLRDQAYPIIGTHGIRGTRRGHLLDWGIMYPVKTCYGHCFSYMLFFFSLYKTVLVRGHVLDAERIFIITLHPLAFAIQH